MVFVFSNNIFFRIFCVSLIFFLKLIYFTVQSANNLVSRLKGFITYLLLMLYYFGEERYIKHKLNEFTFPNHLGIILHKESYPNIFHSLVKLIHWCLLSEIKHLTIYDPFGVITKRFSETFISSVNEVYKRNFSLCFIHKGIAHIHKSVLTIADIKLQDYSLLVHLLSFKEAQEDLLKNIILKGEGKLRGLPSEFEFANEENEFELIDKTRPDTFYTKQSRILPQLLICFNQNEICLNGFPFTLTETSEIMISSSLSKINIIEFIKLFERYSKIDKRLGK